MSFLFRSFGTVLESDAFGSRSQFQRVKAKLGIPTSHLGIATYPPPNPNKFFMTVSIFVTWSVYCDEVENYNIYIFIYCIILTFPNLPFRVEFNSLLYFTSTCLSDYATQFDLFDVTFAPFFAPSVSEVLFARHGGGILSMRAKCFGVSQAAGRFIHVNKVVFWMEFMLKK